jgi:hypothetical protein
MNQNLLNINTLLIRNPNQVFTDVDGEVIMLNVENSEYYNLPGTAGLIWNNLAKPMSIKELVGHLIAEYEISFEDCLKDVQPFINELIIKNIVQISNG